MRSIAVKFNRAASVIANFGRVVGPRGATQRSSGGEARNEGNLKLHPIVTRLVDDETLKRMGAEKMGSGVKQAGN